MTSIRVHLNDDLLNYVDTSRGTLMSRSTWVAELIEFERLRADLPTLHTIDTIIEDGVTRAAQAFKDGRPGYGTFILTRVAMAAGALEELTP